MKTVFKILQVTLLLAIQNLNTIAQENKAYNFYGYLQSEKTLFFSDDFNDDGNGWKNGSTQNGETFIQNGYLIFQSTVEDGAAGCVRSLFHIDQRKDFEFETRMTWTGGVDNKSFYFVFGKKPSEWSRFNFGLSGNGYYLIDKSFQNEYTTIVDWTKSSFVNIKDYNTLTIRKVASTTYYFINGNLVHSQPFESFYGDEIGYQISAKVNISIDYIKVYYLGNSMNSEADYSFYNLAQKNAFFLDDFNSDKNNWANAVSTNGYAYVSKGYLNFKSTSPDGAAGCTNTISGFDSNKDFEIESSMKFLNGNDNKQISLVFGKDPSVWSRYNFGFSGNGYYTIDKSYNNENSDIVNWTFSKLIRIGDFNKYTVRKISNTLYFYVNETLVYSMPFAPFYGNAFGYQTPQGTEIAVDYLKISYLSKPHQTQLDITAPEITMIEPYIKKEQKITETNKQIIVKGRVADTSGIYEVVINGNEAALDQSGNFQQVVKLAVGDNTISVRATDTKDNSSFYTFYVNREVTNATQLQPQEIKPMFDPNEKRIALVIGNSTYEGGQFLKNPENDANLMIQALKNLGFEVISRTNANKKNMERAIREFSEKLPNFNVALFYYAGHGVQVDGMNYLIPTDAELNKKEDCKWEAISVNFVVEEFEKYPNNTNIVILDACRNDPFKSWSRGGERGFKAIVPTSGTIIAFATSEGATASDGDGVNGLFTQELVKQLQIQQPIESVFKKTRVEVERLSKGTQSPQEWSKLKGDFWFKK